MASRLLRLLSRSSVSSVIRQDLPGFSSMACLAAEQKYQISCHRRYCAAPIPAPTADRTYEPKITKLVEDISQLTLKEVADLNELLKSSLNIKETSMMPMAMAAPVKAEEEVVQVEEKSSFSVKLVKFEPTRKVELIKQMKELISGMNLVQAKKFIESAPQVVKADLDKVEAEKLVASINSAGGTAELE